LSVDRAGIATRLRSLLGGAENPDLEGVADRLGVEELSLRMSIDELSPHPTVEVLAAVIRVYGIDPSWLLTGTYDANTHRSVLDGDADPATAVRQFLYDSKLRISQPTRERFRFNDTN
jgi:hypothetical protein